MLGLPVACESSQSATCGEARDKLVEAKRERTRVGLDA